MRKNGNDNVIRKERREPYMAHEILSVKMYELDKKLEQTHSRIQLAELITVIFPEPGRFWCAQVWQELFFRFQESPA